MQAILGGILETKFFLFDLINRHEDMVCVNPADSALVTLFRVYPRGVDADVQFAKELEDPAFRGDLTPKDKRPFAGPGVFVDALDARNPVLSVRSTDVDGLYRVTLDVGYGTGVKRRLVQEGFVFRGASPPGSVP